MMTAEQLKDGILLFAMQGKLSTSCSSDQTITSVLKDIYKDKGRVNPIDSEQIPYDLPEKWEWARLEDITDNCDNPFADGPFGSNLKREHYTEKHEVRIIQLSNIGENGWKDTNEKYTTYEHLKTIERSKVNAGDIVIAKMMPAGRAIEVPESDYAYVLSSDAVKFVAHPILNKRFLLMAINSPVFREQVYSEVHGVTRVRTSLSKLKKYIVPLPPLEEQKRIVAKIEELMPFVEQYATASTKLNKLNATFPEIMKKSILQEAVQGKLVPQDPNDEPASVLLKKIAEEKKRLIKEGKIKKQKPLPEITEDEIPFDIPESWEWCYINDIAFVTKLAGFEYTKNIAPNLTNKGIPLFKGKNVQNGRLVMEFESFIPESISDELSRSQLDRKCLLTPYVGTIGNIAIFNGEFKAHLGSNVGKIEILNSKQTYVMDEYVLHYLRSPEGYKQLTKYKKATAQESISIDAIRNVIIGIPPLREQMRIVEKIDRCMSIADKLYE